MRNSGRSLMPKRSPARSSAAALSRGAREVIFSIGHPLHKPVHPRTPVLFALAGELGFRGRHCDRIEAIAATAEARTGKSMPVNATGALGALSCELGLDWRLCRGLAVIGRAVGLVGHIAEELRRPIAKDIWLATEHPGACGAPTARLRGLTGQPQPLSSDCRG
jgi:citrate synthase